MLPCNRLLLWITTTTPAAPATHPYALLLSRGMVSKAPAPPPTRGVVHRTGVGTSDKCLYLAGARPRHCHWPPSCPSEPRPADLQHCAASRVRGQLVPFGERDVDDLLVMMMMMTTTVGMEERGWGAYVPALHAVSCCSVACAKVGGAVRLCDERSGARCWTVCALCRGGGPDQ